MLNERTEFGMLSVLFDGQIQVRTDTVIERDGVEISRTYHRHVVAPDMDPKDFHPRLKRLCQAMWTSDVIADYEKAKAERAKQRP